MNYAFNHQGKAFTPNQTKLEASHSDAHNAQIEAAELLAWSKQPAHFAVYVGDHRVTTWRGVVLGTILEQRAFRTNISRNMVAIRFRGTNGATYYGRFGADWSQLCRVRKTKK